MTITITAYTDVRSPFTFVAKAEVYRWEQDFDVVVDWWPYTTPLAEAFGPAEGRNERELRKIKYSYMHVRRIAAPQGLTIRGTKRIFDPTPAHVALLQAKDDGVFRLFHDRVFERVFRRELDPDDPEHVRAALAEAGGDVDTWSRRLADGVAELDAINRRAEAQGVFGVPSFVLDDELFWGTDTLALVRQRLSELRSREGTRGPASDRRGPAATAGGTPGSAGVPPATGRGPAVVDADGVPASPGSAPARRDSAV